MSAPTKRIAVLVEEGFEDAGLTRPVEILREAGLAVTLVGPVAGREYAGQRGAKVIADTAASKVRAADVDAVLIPGGYAPDRIRMRHAMVDLVRDALAAGKPVAAMSHGPQVLITADVLGGRTVTCWPSIAVDVRNAGALYVDRPVVVDGTLITSRKPDDVPQFTAAILAALGMEPARS
jgi:protease I